MKKVNKQISACYAASNEYSEYAGISILSLLENDTERIIKKIYLLSFGISEENKKIIEGIIKKYNVSFECIDAINVMKGVFEQISLDLFEGSFATYARAFISEIIPMYDEYVLFIDSDTIVNRNIEELFRYVFPGIEKKAIAAVIGVNQYVVGNEEKYLANGNTIYYQCGVLLYNMQQWKANCCTEKIIEFIKKNGTHYLYADQTIINNSLSNDLMMAIPPKFNYWAHGFRGLRIKYEMSRGRFWTKEEIEEAITNPVIIHYKGQILHPWLEGNLSSFSSCFDYYRSETPWANEGKKTIYFDDKANCETDSMRREMNSCRKYLRENTLKVFIKERISMMKRKILGRRL